MKFAFSLMDISLCVFQRCALLVKLLTMKVAGGNPRPLSLSDNLVSSSHLWAKYELIMFRQDKM